LRRANVLMPGMDMQRVLDNDAKVRGIVQALEQANALGTEVTFKMVLDMDEAGHKVRGNDRGRTDCDSP
jgi:hypothetical protein